MPSDNDTPKNVVLRVKDVHKDFKLPTEKTNSLKGAVFNMVRGNHGYTTQHVLKGVSFDVEQGDFFGIVGKNGSGKSTLLKILSQVYTPTSGSVEVHGKLVPFIELGVGFNPELTGRENVYLNGAMLGFSKEEVDGLYDDVVSFAELEDFMEQKLKNYSSGMQVRLAFSMAIKSQGDILVLDEVLAVGDEAFQKKCQDFFFQAKREKRTIILVTHSMPDVRKYCNKAILIEDGKISKMGSPDEVANAYSDIFFRRQKRELEAQNRAKGLMSGDAVHLDSIRVLSNGAEAEILDINEDYEVEACLTCDRDINAGVFAINIIDEQGRVAIAASNRYAESTANFSAGRHRVSFKIQNDLPYGTFHINAAFAEGHELLLKQENLYTFGVKKDKEYNQVLMHPLVSVDVD